MGVKLYCMSARLQFSLYSVSLVANFSDNQYNITLPHIIQRYFSHRGFPARILYWFSCVLHAPTIQFLFIDSS
jgi:hypothetical protein